LKNKELAFITNILILSVAYSLDSGCFKTVVKIMQLKNF